VLFVERRAEKKIKRCAVNMQLILQILTLIESFNATTAVLEACHLLTGLQAAVTPLGDKGIPIIPGILTLDMYTAAGWVNVLLGVLNCLLFLPSVFRERRIAAREAMLHHGMESGTLLQTGWYTYSARF
jgi:hypothetical protein